MDTREYISEDTSKIEIYESERLAHKPHKKLVPLRDSKNELEETWKRAKEYNATYASYRKKTTERALPILHNADDQNILMHRLI